MKNAKIRIYSKGTKVLKINYKKDALKDTTPNQIICDKSCDKRTFIAFDEIL